MATKIILPDGITAEERKKIAEKLANDALPKISHTIKIILPSSMSGEEKTKLLTKLSSIPTSSIEALISTQDVEYMTQEYELMTQEIEVLPPDK